jgi:hypothetical protein
MKPILATIVLLSLCIAARSADETRAAAAPADQPAGFFLTVGGINGEVDGQKAEAQFGAIYQTADLKKWAEVFKGGPVKEKFNHANNNGLRSMAYGNGTFVAIGNPKCVVISKDGSHWEEIETPTGGFAIAHGGGQFLAGLAYGLMTSKDGRVWTKTDLTKTVPSEGAGHIRKIVAGNGVFLLYGEQRIGVTKDCQTFIDHKIIKEPSHRRSMIAFGAGKFVWLNRETGHRISSDGVNWTPLVFDEATLKEQRDLLWTGDRFLVRAGKILFSSKDGETWERTELPQARTLSTFGNGKLVSYGAWNSNYLTSSDMGKTWSDLQKPDISVHSNCLYFFSGKEIIGIDFVWPN